MKKYIPDGLYLLSMATVTFTESIVLAVVIGILGILANIYLLKKGESKRSTPFFGNILYFIAFVMILNKEYHKIAFFIYVGIVIFEILYNRANA